MPWRGFDISSVISWSDSLHFPCSSNVNSQANMKYGPDVAVTDAVCRGAFSGQCWLLSHITKTSAIYLNIHWASLVQKGQPRSKHWHCYQSNESPLSVVITLCYPATSLDCTARRRIRKKMERCRDEAGTPPPALKLKWWGGESRDRSAHLSCLSRLNRSDFFVTSQGALFQNRLLMVQHIELAKGWMFVISTVLTANLETLNIVRMWWEKEPSRQKKGPHVLLWLGRHTCYPPTYKMRNNSTDFGPTCTSVTSGSEKGWGCREQRAVLLWRDRITEWLSIHECKSAGAQRGCGVKTPPPLATGQRQSTLCSPRPDHSLPQNKWKHATVPTPAPACIFTAIRRKAPPDCVHNATFSVWQPSRASKKKTLLKIHLYNLWNKADWDKDQNQNLIQTCD